MEIRSFNPEDEKAVVALWQRCDLVRPWNDPRRDLRRKLGVRPDLFLVGILDGQVVASVMAGYEGIGVGSITWPLSPSCSGVGAIVAEAERLLWLPQNQFTDSHFQSCCR